MDWQDYTLVSRCNGPLHGIGEEQYLKTEDSSQVHTLESGSVNNLLCIISDYTSNVKKAFAFCFPLTTRVERHESDYQGEDDYEIENDYLWEDTSETLQEDVDTTQSSCQQQCFAHSLHLTVWDGLKKTKIINCALAKVKFFSLLHTTCELKEAFEKTYGANQSIPSFVATSVFTTVFTLYR